MSEFSIPNPPEAVEHLSAPNLDCQRSGELGETIHPELPPSVLDAIESAGYEPAVAEPYIGTAQRGPEIHENLDEAGKAIAYAESLFPDSDFSFIGSGRYGVVLGDAEGRAFKVYRSALHYSRYEKEAGALQLLSEDGLTPQLHLLLDADTKYRLDKKSYDYTTFGFEDVEIPRQDSGRELPVLIMDKIDTKPIEYAQPAKFIDGFCQTVNAFMRHGIYSHDTEVEINAYTGNVVILDVGELYQRKVMSGLEVTPRSKAEKEQGILREVVIDFGISKYEHVIRAAYQEGGMDAVRTQLERIAV